MTTSSLETRNNLFNWIIGVLSIAIPIVVAILFYMPKSGSLGLNVSFLPLLNASLNSATAVCLIAGLIFIKKENRAMHATSMISAFGLSSIFLISYVIYHFSVPSTRYGDLNHDGVVSAIELTQAGSFRYVYYFIVLTHIFLATIVVPFILFAIYFGATKQYEKHKRIVKYTFPMWLYVAITGVLVYYLISPYYPHN